MGIKASFKDEIYQVIKKLEELRSLFPNAEINYIEGNHEFRLMRYLVNKAPELFELFTLPELLQFDRLSINYVPFGKQQKFKCLGTNYYLRHQPYSQSKHCASVTAHMKGINLGFGHTHRVQTYTFKNGDGKRVTCRSLGWLGNPNHPIFEYVDHDNWSQGFEFVYAFENEWFAHYVDIIDYKAVYNGIQYSN